ncbi:MAG: outer membrane protein assembly factor BamD [Acidobacteriota bacterium]|nr:outer membrane protein assembly factor BamD [Acidobacteriota bacterium]
MLRRIPVLVLLGVLAVTTACSNKKVNNPLANVDSKQPDKVLFDRAMDALKHNRFDVARITLQTLINTYPDSEYIARAKLAVADSWYAEGGSTNLTQAEIEYKDFITFFPNMPEAAEAQLKIANIHYREMEKPDRDYTHAMRAEEEYRQLIMQWPDSKLVPEAKKHLLEVQEVIAERQFRVGRFYFYRQSYPAAIARLKTLADQYPLYSQADESLFLLGQAYEGEIAMLRARPLNEVQKARMIQEFANGATQAYSRILTRYPVMNRADDAKLRLQDLHQKVPRATKAAIAQNKAEENSRLQASTMTKVMKTFAKHPDMAPAARVGEPTLVDPKAVSATEVVQEANKAALGISSGGKESASVETVKSGTPPPTQPAPRSDSPLDSGPTVNNAPVDNTTANSGAITTAPEPAAGSASSQPDPNELKPNVTPDANELKSNVASDAGQATPPPAQVNEIQQGSPTPDAAGNSTASDKSDASKTDEASEDSTVSSSKHKKKKGIHKIVPF